MPPARDGSRASGGGRCEAEGSSFRLSPASALEELGPGAAGPGHPVRPMPPMARRRRSGPRSSSSGGGGPGYTAPARAQEHGNHHGLGRIHHLRAPRRERCARGDHSGPPAHHCRICRLEPRAGVEQASAYPPPRGYLIPAFWSSRFACATGTPPCAAGRFTNHALPRSQFSKTCTAVRRYLHNGTAQPAEGPRRRRPPQSDFLREALIRKCAPSACAGSRSGRPSGPPATGASARSTGRRRPSDRCSCRGRASTPAAGSGRPGRRGRRPSR